MSIGKKIFLLLVALVILIIYTVSTFKYKTILNENQVQSLSFYNQDSMFGEYTNLFIIKTEELKNLVLEKIGLFQKEKIIKDKKYITLELVKENDIVLMNGIFKDKEEVKSIIDLLNINRDGEYVYESNRVKDVVLLNKLVLLMDSFKEFFRNDSRLLLKDGKVLLEGELKDSNLKPLLDSIILKSNLDVITNIKEPVKSKTEEIIDDIKKLEDKVGNEDSNLVKSELGKTKVNSKKVKEAQKRIHTLTLNNKVTFKRQSTNITEKSRSIVNEIANILLENSKLKIEIAGHTDSRGRASLNKRISQDRANSVKNELVSLGVDSGRIKAIGYGEDFPIEKDDANGLSKINRRVEFIIGEVQ